MIWIWKSKLYSCLVKETLGLDGIFVLWESHDLMIDGSNETRLKKFLAGEFGELGS